VGILRKPSHGLRPVGWGIFKLPGETKRLEKLRAEAEELLAEKTSQLETEVETRGEVNFSVFKNEDGSVFYLEAHDRVDPEDSAAYPLDRDEARRLGQLLLRAAR
jgi:hypothetical protein